MAMLIGVIAIFAVFAVTATVLMFAFVMATWAAISTAQRSGFIRRVRISITCEKVFVQ